MGWFTNRTFISLAVVRNVLAENTALVAVSLVACVFVNECLFTTIQTVDFFIIKNICKDNSLNLNEKHFCYSKTHTEYKVGHFAMQFAFFILKT